MSAREALLRSVYSLKAMSQNDMEKLVDAFAHELGVEFVVSIHEMLACRCRGARWGQGCG